MKSPLVSVIVHTKNSDRTIRRHLNSIKKQTYRNIEIIAVDNYSKDSTPNVLSKYTSKFFQMGPERSAQRNFGVKKSKGKFILIPDSDMILGNDVIRQCVDLCLNNSRVKAVVIPEQSIGKGYWTRCKALERKCYLGDDNIEAARFFEKVVFNEFGGYDENITGPEDWDLPRRIKQKYEIGRIDEFIYHDDGKSSLVGFAKKKFYYGLKSARYFSKHSGTTNISQALYILRPAFYKNWKLLLINMPVTFGMICMLFVEQCAGGLGYLIGKYRNG